MNDHIESVCVVELTNEREFKELISKQLRVYAVGCCLLETVAITIAKIQDKYFSETHTYKLIDCADQTQAAVAEQIIEYYYKEEPETDIAEIEIPILAEYAAASNRALQKTKNILDMQNNRETIAKYFSRYIKGAWAWNTVCGKLESHFNLSWKIRNTETAVLINLYALYLYRNFFKELYKREFTLHDIPIQCEYLIDFAVSKAQPEPANGWWGSSEKLYAEIEKIYPPNLKEKENTMNKIETVTFINGNSANDMSDDQIFDLIAQTEKDIEKLEAIKEKPEKLTAKIKAMQASITELVKIVDERP